MLLTHIRSSKFTEYLFLFFIHHTVRNPLYLLRKEDIPNHLECLQKLYLDQFRFPDLLVRGHRCIHKPCKCTFSYCSFFIGFLIIKRKYNQNVQFFFFLKGEKSTFVIICNHILNKTYHVHSTTIHFYIHMYYPAKLFFVGTKKTILYATTVVTGF